MLLLTLISNTMKLVMKLILNVFLDQFKELILQTFFVATLHTPFCKIGHSIIKNRNLKWSWFRNATKRINNSVPKFIFDLFNQGIPPKLLQ